MTKVRGKTWLTLSQLGESAESKFFLLLSSQSLSSSHLLPAAQIHLVPALTVTMGMGWIPHAPHSSMLPTAIHWIGQQAHGYLTMNINSHASGIQDFHKHSGHRNLLQHMPGQYAPDPEALVLPAVLFTATASLPLPCSRRMVQGHRGREQAAVQSHSQHQSISLVPACKRALHVGQLKRN